MLRLPFRAITGGTSATLRVTGFDDGSVTSQCCSGEHAGELIIHRPRFWSPGAGRLFRLDLDGRHIGDLSYGATVRVQVYPGSYVLRARCRPLVCAQLPLTLAAHQTLRLLIHVGLFGELRISTADPRDGKA